MLDRALALIARGVANAPRRLLAAGLVAGFVGIAIAGAWLTPRSRLTDALAPDSRSARAARSLQSARTLGAPILVAVDPRGHREQAAALARAFEFELGAVPGVVAVLAAPTIGVGWRAPKALTNTACREALRDATSGADALVRLTAIAEHAVSAQDREQARALLVEVTEHLAGAVRAESTPASIPSAAVAPALGVPLPAGVPAGRVGEAPGVPNALPKLSIDRTAPARSASAFGVGVRVLGPATFLARSRGDGVRPIAARKLATRGLRLRRRQASPLSATGGTRTLGPRTIPRRALGARRPGAPSRVTRQNEAPRYRYVRLDRVPAEWLPSDLAFAPDAPSTWLVLETDLLPRERASLQRWVVAYTLAEVRAVRAGKRLRADDAERSAKAPGDTAGSVRGAAHERPSALRKLPPMLPPQLGVPAGHAAVPLAVSAARPVDLHAREPRGPAAPGVPLTFGPLYGAVLFLEPGRDSLSALNETLAALRTRIAALAKRYPSVTIGITGWPVLLAQGRATVVEGLWRSMAVSAACVWLVVVLLLGPLRATVLILGLGAAIGLTAAGATLVAGSIPASALWFALFVLAFGGATGISVLIRYERAIAERLRSAARATGLGATAEPHGTEPGGAAIAPAGAPRNSAPTPPVLPATMLREALHSAVLGARAADVPAALALAAAFLGFAVAGTPALAWLGALTAVGLLLSTLLMLSLVPAAVVVRDQALASRGQGRALVMPRWRLGLTRRVARRPILSLVTLTASALLVIPSLGRLTTRADRLTDFAAQSTGVRWASKLAQDGVPLVHVAWVRAADAEAAVRLARALAGKPSVGQVVTRTGLLQTQAVARRRDRLAQAAERRALVRTEPLRAGSAGATREALETIEARSRHWGRTAALETAAGATSSPANQPDAGAADGWRVRRAVRTLVATWEQPPGTGGRVADALAGALDAVARAVPPPASRRSAGAARAERSAPGAGSATVAGSIAARDSNAPGTQHVAPIIDDALATRKGEPVLAIIPKQPLWDPAARRRFVADVRDLAPEASGPAFVLAAQAADTRDALERGTVTALLVLVVAIVLFERRLFAAASAIVLAALGTALFAGGLALARVSLGPSTVVVFAIVAGVLAQQTLRRTAAPRTPEPGPQAGGPLAVLVPLVVFGGLLIVPTPTLRSLALLSIPAVALGVLLPAVVCVAIEALTKTLTKALTEAHAPHAGDTSSS